jgi:hypothetical protein
VDGDAGGLHAVPHRNPGGVQTASGERGHGEGDLHELPCAAYAGGVVAVKRERSVGRMISDAMHLALILPVAVVVGYGIGAALDHVFGTKFWGVFWLIVGVIAGMRDLIRKLNKEFDRDKDVR